MNIIVKKWAETSKMETKNSNTMNHRLGLKKTLSQLMNREEEDAN